MSYNLFLDDSRFPNDVKWIELPSVNWVIVRSYKQFVDCIMECGVPTMVSFDHDLADEHYKEYYIVHDQKMIGEKKIRYDRFTEKTGRDCALWLAQYCVDKGIQVPLYYLHSLNGVGCANIHSILESARKIINERTSGNITDWGSWQRQNHLG